MRSCSDLLDELKYENGRINKKNKALMSELETLHSENALLSESNNEKLNANVKLYEIIHELKERVKELEKRDEKNMKQLELIRDNLNKTGEINIELRHKNEALEMAYSRLGMMFEYERSELSALKESKTIYVRR